MKNTIISALALAVLFTACKKDKTITQPADPNAFNVSVSGKIVSVKNLPADTIVGLVGGQPVGVGKYSFFNLRTNTWVANTDSASANWDLAFSGSTIRINAGTSGPAAGGAFVWVGSFDNLATIPADSVFKTDNYPAYAITKGSGKGWYSYDGATNLLNPIPGRVLVIKTANGKYAKVEILNYYRGGVTPSASATDEVKTSEQRYYTFRYTFQSNGSTTF
ncbi:MAG: HmuY family protein [Sphingobacteriales bacterium]|nr:HmuY family protein [Sphingobacteriales bacterium]